MDKLLGDVFTNGLSYGTQLTAGYSTKPYHVSKVHVLLYAPRAKSSVKLCLKLQI